MYMLPDTVALTDVPDIGGTLMQWHIHDNLCFTTDPVAPKVAGLTNADGTCRAGLRKLAARTDDPRLDHPEQVRAVLRAGGRRRRPGPARRDHQLRPRPRLSHRPARLS